LQGVLRIRVEKVAVREVGTRGGQDSGFKFNWVGKVFSFPIRANQGGGKWGGVGVGSEQAGRFNL